MVQSCRVYCSSALFCSLIKGFGFGCTAGSSEGSVTAAESMSVNIHSAYTHKSLTSIHHAQTHQSQPPKALISGGTPDFINVQLGMHCIHHDMTLSIYLSIHPSIEWECSGQHYLEETVILISSDICGTLMYPSYLQNKDRIQMVLSHTTDLKMTDDLDY